MMSKAVGTIRVSVNTIRMFLDKIRKRPKRIRKSVDGIRESQRRLSLFLRMISKKGEGLNSVLSFFFAPKGQIRRCLPPPPVGARTGARKPIHSRVGAEKRFSK